MSERRHNIKEKDHHADEVVDSVAAVVIIAAIVIGVVYWLTTMPS